ncbi:MAG: HAD family hydrolase [Bacteroidota bacterium]
MKYNCVIFDCDGVLVDSVEISIKTLIDMAESQGVEISYEFAVTNFSGSALKKSFDYIEQKGQLKLPETFEGEYRKRTSEAFKKELKPINGIHKALEKIPIPYCVASSGPLSKIEANLNTTNLLDKFKGKMFSSYEIDSWKPDPDIFIHAAKEMGFKPESCLVIEDSVEGIRAAKQGSFNVLAYANKNNKHILKQEGVKIFEDMHDLEYLIDLD